MSVALPTLCNLVSLENRVAVVQKEVLSLLSSEFLESLPSSGVTELFTAIKNRFHEVHSFELSSMTQLSRSTVEKFSGYFCTSSSIFLSTFNMAKDQELEVHM